MARVFLSDCLRVRHSFPTRRAGTSARIFLSNISRLILRFRENIGRAGSNPIPVDRQFHQSHRTDHTRSTATVSVDRFALGATNPEPKGIRQQPIRRRKPSEKVSSRVVGRTCARRGESGGRTPRLCWIWINRGRGARSGRRARVSPEPRAGPGGVDAGERGGARRASSRETPSGAREPRLREDATTRALGIRHGSSEVFIASRWRAPPSSSPGRFVGASDARDGAPARARRRGGVRRRV